jgi:hypothetical protein
MLLLPLLRRMNDLADLLPNNIERIHPESTAYEQGYLSKKFLASILDVRVPVFDACWRGRA